MGNTKDSFGKPVFDDVYSFPQDSQDAVDFAFDFAFVRGGTSAERQVLEAGKRRPGMLFSESDTGDLYRVDSDNGWVQLVSAERAFSVITPGSSLWRFDWPGFLPGAVSREGDRVFMQGILSNGQTLSVAANTEYKVGTIPLALAPAAAVYYPTYAAGNGMAMVSVRANGDVYLQTLFSGGPYASGTFTVWLDGFTWPAKV